MRCSALLALAVAASAASAAAVTTEDLQRVADQSTVDLVTIGRKSGTPRTATIWFVHDAGRVWVQSGNEGKTDWYRNLRAKPEATLKFDGLTMHGNARPVDDPAEAERVHQLFRDKYLTARVMSWFGGGFGQGKVVLVTPDQ